MNFSFDSFIEPIPFLQIPEAEEADWLGCDRSFTLEH
jgi:hypothetical protein